MVKKKPSSFIPNWVDGREVPAVAGEEFPKLNPATGKELFKAARSRAADVDRAVQIARRAQPGWAKKSPVERGDLIRSAALLMRDQLEEVAEIVHRETGKSLKDARGETGAAIEQGMFVAGEGRRSYGRTTTSASPTKIAMTVRQPVGVAALIVPANTPIANVAWKAFPALLCGNSAVLKSTEDAPATAWIFARILHEVGVPPGVFQVLHGYGEEAGGPLVEHGGVDLISFTGSFRVGCWVQEKAARRLAKVCIEAGGKNALIVCDDADLDAAAEAAVLSAFSNAGQRCAAGSRIVVFDKVYDDFKKLLLERTKPLKLGTADTDDLGPVINERQLKNMLAAVEKAKSEGATILCGGGRRSGEGYYMQPTWIEGAKPDSDISRSELFGPISCLYRVKDYREAVDLANDSPFGLTASIHTKNTDRAMTFLSEIRTGVGTVNGPTYGSEPHMPFGGLALSGNGTREAGTEALDVYSEWKTIYINYRPSNV